MLLLQLIPVSTDKTFRLRMFVTFSVMFVYGAFRVNYGYDYPTYEEFYDAVHSYGLLETRVEAGYTFLNKIMPSFRTLLIITSALTCFAYYWMFTRFVTPQWTWLGIILLFLSGDKSIFFMFSGIRNAIVVALLILSLKLIQERKLLLFALLTFFAIQFHQSAIFVFPIVYLLGTGAPMTKTKLWIWGVFFVVMTFLSTTVLIDFFSTFIDQYFERYNSYMEKAEEYGDYRSSLVLGSCSIMAFSILYYLYLGRDKLTKEQNFIGVISLCFIISYLLGSLNLRFSQYFMPFFILSTINIVRSSIKPIVKWGFLAFVLLFLGFVFFVVYLQSPTFPYQEYNSILF